MAKLQAPQRRRLYEQLVQQLLTYIHLSGLQPGDRLPSERELAADMQVSRVSLRQATVALEVQGLLEVRHGGGIYVRAVDPAPDHISELLTRRARLPEVLEAREALETMTARLAATRRTAADLRAMDEALALMSAETERGELGDNGDAAFHLAVTTAAGNAVLSQLMEMLAPRVHESRVASLSEPGRPPKSLAAHQRIAEAIRSGDPRAAEAAMRRHLRVVADVGLLRWNVSAEPPERAVNQKEPGAEDARRSP
jgi:GntR family transcriptional repressor for pyruvate dehydrogenase complex